MKSIKTKFSLMIIAIMCAVLLLGNITIFVCIRNMISKRISKDQSFIASSNKMGIQSFLNSLDQSSLYIISDKLVGEILNTKYDDNAGLTQARANLNSRFYHSSTSLTQGDSYLYKNIIFLNDHIEFAKHYEPSTLYDPNELLCGVFSNSAVKDEIWYKNTTKINSGLNIFVDKNGKTIYLARNLSNVHYIGPYQNEGIGVIVTEIKINNFANFFKFSNITPHTQVLLINRYNDILYSVSQKSVNDVPDFLKHQKNEIKDMSIKYGNEHYIVNKRNLDWGISLVFLTPYSDINKEMNEFQQIYIIGSLLMIVLVTLASLFVTGRITKPIIFLSNTMKKLHDTREINHKSIKLNRNDEIGTLYQSFDEMIDKINLLIGNVTLQTQKQKEMELKALQAQINPHFLYNSMDSVNWIALINGQDEIANMVSLIAKIMRYAISNPNDIVTLNDEFKNIENYVTLQRIRYKNRIILSVNVNEECKSLSVPKFILQPLIENSILHGFTDSQDILNINVCASFKDGVFLLSVTDDGKGCNSNQLNEYLNGIGNELKVSSGFGIKNINERLKIKFKNSAELSYVNLKNGKLKAQIKIDYANFNFKDFISSKY